MRRPPVGQAVVSDLGGTAASGYTLLAASPAVVAADADLLAARPQVSDHLHLAAEEATHYSFHRLPSGAWGLSRRFSGGRRRGGYNRVVVHTLVLTREALAAVAEDPWLLLAADRFVGPGGGAAAVAELDAALADPGLRALPDLELLAPAEPGGERRALLARRRDLLAEHWGRELLARRLGWVLAALEAGRRVLLPQGREGENLLALAFSALPAADRPLAGWSTHLGPGGAELVRLAAVPRPAEARREQERPEEWLVPEETVATAGGGEELAAAVVAADRAALDDLYAGLRAHGLSLLADGSNLRRWLASRGLLAPDGYAGAEELAAALDKLRLAPGERLDVPGLAAADLLRAAAATLRRTVDGGAALTPAVEAVWGALEAAGLGDAVATEEAASTVAAAAEPRTATLAVGLVLRRLHRRREIAGDGLVDALRRADPPTGDPAVGGVLQALALRLLAAGSPRAAEVLPRLACEGPGLASLRRRLGPGAPPLVTVLALVEAAGRAGDAAAARGFAATDLVARLADEPEAAAAEPGRTAAALPLLRADGEAWLEALRRWQGRAYRLLLADLAGWLAEAPAAARAAVAAAAAEPEAVVRAVPEVLGLAAAAARAGAPAADWVPFALAEARYREAGAAAPAAADRAGFLAGVEVPPDEAAPAARRLLATLQREAAAGHSAGALHRRLLERLSGGVAAWPAEVAPALAALENLPWEELAAWAPVVADLGRALDGAGHTAAASAVRRAWWQQAAVREPAAALPPEAPGLLRALVPDDAGVVAALLTPRVPALPAGAAEDELVRALAAAVPSGAAFNADLARLVREVRLGRLPLDEAYRRAEERARAAGEAPRRLQQAARELLPAPGADRLREVCRLLLSPRVWPTGKAWLEEAELARNLEQPGGVLAEVLPPVASLAGRPTLLLAAGRALGRAWHDDPQRTAARLEAGVAAGRWDFAAAFLAGSAEVRRGFLRWLVRDERHRALVRAFERALRDPVGRWQLAPWEDRLRDLAA